jgi:hypothetical protein
LHSWDDRCAPPLPSLLANTNFLALNCSPPHLCLLNSWEVYRQAEGIEL